MNSISRATVALVLSSALLLSSACRKDEPAADPESQPLAAEATPTPEDETPEEFIRRWFKAQVDMQNSGEVDEYLSMTHECAYCQKTAEMIEGYYSAGGYVDYEGDQIKSIEPYHGSESRFLVKVHSLQTEYATAKGAETRRLKGGRIEYIVTLEKGDPSWQVLDMTQYVS